jgi:hypothetical protein
MTLCQGNGTLLDATEIRLRPHQGFVFRPRDIPLSAIAAMHIFVAGDILYSSIAWWIDGGTAVFVGVVYSVIHLAVSIHILFVRFFVDSILRTSTLYVMSESGVRKYCTKDKKLVWHVGWLEIRRILLVKDCCGTTTVCLSEDRFSTARFWLGIPFPFVWQGCYMIELVRFPQEAWDMFKQNGTTFES